MKPPDFFNLVTQQSCGREMVVLALRVRLDLEDGEKDRLFAPQERCGLSVQGDPTGL